MSLKNPVTSPGIDPGTVRLVAHRLNHYATPGPKQTYSKKKITEIRLNVVEFTLISRQNLNIYFENCKNGDQKCGRLKNSFIILLVMHMYS